jgi:Carboxypeptidase regulatory-like domain
MTLLAAAVLAAVTAASPQNVQTAPQKPPGPAPQGGLAPRDAAPNAKGTAILRGRVLNTEGRPLRRVQIRLGGELIPEGRTASTNGLGRWEIRELPAGRFSLSASRAGYLPSQFGQKRYGEPGRPIELGDGETIENIDQTLTHNGVITGHVYDEAGEPLAGANVMPMQMRFFNGRKRLVPTRGRATTDDSGLYRLGGLDPGEYYVYATSQETWETEPPNVKTMGFMPTMYPAATSMSEAQRVRVRAGQEVMGIDVPLVPGLASTVSGTVVSSQGLPLVGETVNLNIEIRGENFASFSGGASAKVNPDGTFVFRNVAPGEYHLLARQTPTDRPMESANVVVNVAGGDVDGVNVVTSAAGAVAGRVILEPGTTLPIALTRLSVRALPVERDTQTNFGSAPDNGRVREDGSFELKTVIGSNRLTIAPLPDGWAIREIDQNGRDLASQPFDPQGQTLEGATVVLTNRFPTLTAALHDAKGAPTLEGILLLFPEDAAAWAEDLRLVRTGRPGKNGSIVLKAVRPGAYLVAAVPSVTSSQWNDPEYLESLRAQAKRIAVKENEPAQMDVVVKAPGGL